MFTTPVSHFFLCVLPDQMYSKSVPPFFRTSGIEFEEYECYGLICNVANHVLYTFKRTLKTKHKLKM